uniref:SKP1 component dimerisation domain-containing protein n=1 Tax=Musa acuminata subsp. malaccensis TaxID=214687 RepID=A0A804HRU0_MUSAM|nr:PREDICTED: SKP1-like protein 20 isoform X2 [Musa acuminata subsp. malaccensis]
MLNLSRPFPYLLTFVGRSPQLLAAKNPSLSIRLQIRSSGPQNKMSGNEIALNKTQQAKSSYVWIQTNDGLIQQVEGEFVTVCPLIHREMLRTGLGSCKNNPIPLPEQVSPAILSSILHYCRFHQVPGHSDKERKSFDEKFMKTDTDRLVELISAAHSLELSPLVDLISRAIARIIEGSSNDEIREIFRVPDDLTEEEKLEPLRNPTNNLYIRLLNQHLARKRKNLKEQKELKNVELEKKQEDKRTVEELLELINGKDEDLKCVRASKCKRKSKKRKNKAQSSSVNYLNCPDVKEVGVVLPPMRTSDDGAEDFSCTETEFDDDLDQEKMRENDRIVAEFARRLRLIDYR